MYFHWALNFTPLTLKGYLLHDTGMTFIPERVHSISIYLFPSVHTIPRRNFVPVQVVWVIPVFIPNEILPFCRHKLSFKYLACKLKTNLNFVLDWKSKSYSLEREWRMRIWSGRKITRARTPYAEPSDLIMWMQYELHSGTKLIPEWKSFRYHINST